MDFLKNLLMYIVYKHMETLQNSHIDTYFDFHRGPTYDQSDPFTHTYPLELAVILIWHNPHISCRWVLLQQISAILPLNFEDLKLKSQIIWSN